MRWILLFLFGILTTLCGAQFFAWYPTSIEDLEVDLLRDTIVFDQFGNKIYEVDVDEVNEKGVYTLYYSRKKKKKNPKICTEISYRIEKDTSYYTQDITYDRHRELRSKTVWSKNHKRIKVTYFDGLVWEFEQTWPDLDFIGQYREYYSKYPTKDQLWFEGKYRNDYRIGKWTEYHSNGKIKMVGKFEKAYRRTIIHHYGNDQYFTVITDQGDTTFTDTTHILDYDEQRTRLRSRGLMDNGFGNHLPWRYYNRHGKWKHYSKTGKLFLIEKWKQGWCIDSILVDTTATIK